MEQNAQQKGLGVVRGQSGSLRPTLRAERHGPLMQGGGSEAGCKPSRRDLGGPRTAEVEGAELGRCSISPWGRQSWEKQKWLLAAPGAGKTEWRQ